MVQLAYVQPSMATILRRRMPCAGRTQVAIRVNLLEILAHLIVEAIGRQAGINLVEVFPCGNIRRIASARHSVAHQVPGVPDGLFIVGAC